MGWIGVFDLDGTGRETEVRFELVASVSAAERRKRLSVDAATSVPSAQPKSKLTTKICLRYQPTSKQTAPQCV
jgi:hypothetical protein